MKTDEFILNKEMKSQDVAAALGLEMGNDRRGLVTYLVDDTNDAQAFIGVDGTFLGICEGKSTDALVDKILAIATPYDYKA